MSAPADVRIELIESEADFPAAFEVTAHAFGHQARDTIWRATNPGWDTPEGVQQNAARLAKRWRGVTKDSDGNANTVFLKATVPDPEDPSRRAIAGFAIWQQCSMIEGRGVPVSEDPRADRAVAELYPDDEAEQRFISQAMYSLHSPRRDRVKAIAQTDKPALLALDICAVHPRFQRRGIAGKLVQWGLAEAERRGGLEAVMEASVMGRPVYKRLGFQEFGEIVYHIDEEFGGRDMPPNVFMRSRAD
ncbi:hypothetical protein VUR80DRAFT_1314 [Thermomyces stellatus]